MYKIMRVGEERTNGLHK